jgi:cytochrome c biogenesis factor
MWFLSFIPDSMLKIVIHSMVFAGLFLTFGGNFLKDLPVVGAYVRIARQLGIAMFVIGVFFEGGYATEMSYRTRIAEMQKKIDEAEKKSVELNETLTNELSKKRDDIKDKVKQNAKDIQAQRQKIDAECRLSDTAWLLYNRSVDPKVSGSTNSFNGTGTNTKNSTGR